MRKDWLSPRIIRKINAIQSEQRALPYTDKGKLSPAESRDKYMRLDRSRKRLTNNYFKRQYISHKDDIQPLSEALREKGIQLVSVFTPPETEAPVSEYGAHNVINEIRAKARLEEAENRYWTTKVDYLLVAVRGVPKKVVRKSWNRSEYQYDEDLDGGTLFFWSWSSAAIRARGWPQDKFDIRVLLGIF